MADGGSVQNIPEIPSDVKEVFRTVWEIKQRSLIDMAAERGAFIDQSQSLNAFMSQPDYGKLTSMHFYAWKKGLKTGMYYLRTKPAAHAIQFTLDPEQHANGGDRLKGGSDRQSADSNDSYIRNNNGYNTTASSRIGSLPYDALRGKQRGDLNVFGDVCISCSG